MPLKNTGHHNTGIGPEEVEEETMTTVRTLKNSGVF
jgi:hypothetical protein